MIRLTRLNQIPLVLNSDLIEYIEMTPDTVISLTSGQKFMVRETSEQVIERIIQFRREVMAGIPAYGWHTPVAANVTASQPHAAGIRSDLLWRDES